MKTCEMSDKIRKFIRKILNEENNINDNFNKWFSGSKVVNKDGSPLIVYHGTGEKFSKFNLKKATQGIIWFTSDKSTIEAGEAGAQGKGHVMELYVSLKNPAFWPEYEKYGLGQLESMGYDGAILSDGNEINGFVFEPNQLKSVANKGEWDINNKNIFKEEVVEKTLPKITKLSGEEFFHQTDCKNAYSIKKDGFKTFLHTGQARFTHGVYFLSHPEGKYGNCTLTANIYGNFFDFRNDELGDDWFKFRDSFDYDNDIDLTTKIRSYNKNIDGLIFDNILVVWYPKKSIKNITT